MKKNKDMSGFEIAFKKVKELVKNYKYNDSEVYKFYGLTEEEIKIVEGKQ